MKLIDLSALTCLCLLFVSTAALHVNSLYIRQAPSKHYVNSPPDNRHPAALPDTSIRPLGPSPHRQVASYKAVQRSYGIAIERVQDFERLHGDDHRNYNIAASII